MLENTTCADSTAVKSQLSMLPAAQRTVAVKRMRISDNITFRLFVNISSSPKGAGAISCVKMPWLACTLWRNQLVCFVAVMGQCVRT